MKESLQGTDLKEILMCISDYVYQDKHLAEKLATAQDKNWSKIRSVLDQDTAEQDEFLDALNKL